MALLDFFLATYNFNFFVKIYKGHVLCLNSVCVCVFVCPVIVGVAQYGIDECDCTHIYCLSEMKLLFRV